MTTDWSGPNGRAYVISAARTPIGKFGGALAGTPAVALGGVAIAAAVARANLPPDAPIDEVLMGQVLQGVSGRRSPRLTRAGSPTRSGPSRWRSNESERNGR